MRLILGVFAAVAAASTVAQNVGYSSSVSSSEVDAALATVEQLERELEEARAHLVVAMGFGADSGVLELTAAAGPCPFTWARDLSTGVNGDDVLALQRFLNMDADTRVALSGPGSPGQETNYFGSATQDAVKRFQAKYRNEILGSASAQPTGYFGIASRTKANSMCSSSPPPTSSPVPAPIAGASSAQSTRDRVASLALSKQGSAYVYAQAGPSSFDCSGLVRWAWGQVGVSVPHSARAQYDVVSRFSSMRDAVPGDLVFFLRNGPDHVGIYIGNGRMIHAASTSLGVITGSVKVDGTRFTGFGRVRI